MANLKKKQFLGQLTPHMSAYDNILIYGWSILSPERFTFNEFLVILA